MITKTIDKLLTLVFKHNVEDQCIGLYIVFVIKADLK